jgi:hypothetical protein
MTNIINLTPHDINVVLADGSVRTFPKSGAVVRVATFRSPGPEVDGIPTFETKFGAVEGLPDVNPEVIYITSALVASRCADRADVFAPGELVRDDGGNVIGCRGLSRG